MTEEERNKFLIEANLAADRAIEKAKRIIEIVKGIDVVSHEEQVSSYFFRKKSKFFSEDFT